MTLVNIDLRNQGYETGDDDRVVFYSLLVREGDFGTISTAPVEVPLVDGKASVDLAPGPVGVQIIAGQVADTRVKIGEVPPSGPTTLTAVMMVTPAYTPALQAAMIAEIRDAQDEALVAIASARLSALAEVQAAVTTEMAAQMGTKADKTQVEQLAGQVMATMGLASSASARLAAQSAVTTAVTAQMDAKADKTTVEQLAGQVMAAMGMAGSALRRNNT